MADRPRPLSTNVRCPVCWVEEGDDCIPMHRRVPRHMRNPLKHPHRERKLAAEAEMAKLIGNDDG